MFILNFKVNKKKLTKVIFIFIGFIITIYFLITVFNIYKSNFKVTDKNQSNISYIESQNYTNVLKSVHDNLDEYIGNEICFTGYVFRLDDFKDTEFVLARDMIINSNMETLIVGFLCDCKNAKEFANDTWVEITGKIEKGNYNGEIPIIKITNIKQTTKPSEDIYVYPPTDTYVPTFNLL